MELSLAAGAPTMMTDTKLQWFLWMSLLALSFQLTTNVSSAGCFHLLLQKTLLLKKRRYIWMLNAKTNLAATNMVCFAPGIFPLFYNGLSPKQHNLLWATMPQETWVFQPLTHMTVAETWYNWPGVNAAKLLQWGSWIKIMPTCHGWTVAKKMRL